ncbi:DsbA family protein [Rhodopila sp.]|uniref:DsbA family protein n=1 Tax=Rhodopila sp. TaxID=2480087 RepID=UPI003D095D6D
MSRLLLSARPLSGRRLRGPLSGALVLGGLVLLAWVGAAWAGAARAAEFTPAQRAEIVSIVREALKQDPSILRDAVVALQADEGERGQQASRAAIAQSRNQLVTPADPVAGDPHGDVTIVEFFDTRCPYCRKMEPVMEKLLAADHRVRLVYKDLPILGPASVLGTKALLAAQQQGAYDKMRAAVMQLPPDTTIGQVETAAHALGLDWPRMARDMDAPSVQARIDANLALAHRLGIQGTPALVIGDNLVPGAVDLAELQKAVAEGRGG